MKDLGRKVFLFMKYLFFISCSLMLFIKAKSQYYTGLNGTYYIGSLTVHNNPAAIVNSPFKWDLTVFGIQDRHSTNIVDIHEFSLLSNPANSEYSIKPGEYKRKGDVNVNLNLLNFRVALNNRSAIAGGINFRSYTRVRTSQYNFYDTLQSFRDFFVLNENNRDNMKLDMTSGSWMEIYGSYGQTILDNDYMRLNGGVTFKINRGLSGGFANLNGGSFTKTGTFPDTYLVNNASINFSYSANYDQLDNDKDFNFRNFASGTKTGFSLDAGLELLIRRPYTTNRQREEEFFDYDWKIGISLIDAGFSSYQHGKYNARLSVVKPGIMDGTLDNKFDTSITTFGQFRDSIGTLFQNNQRYVGDFKILHPARLVINVDKFIDEAFFVNADLSIGVSSLTPFKSSYLKDLSFLTVTPRWETRRKGFYLPIQYNSANQLWVGGAVRFGPVLFGLHNFANLFSKNKIQRGVGYLAIILKPSQLTTEKSDKRLDCW